MKLERAHKLIAFALLIGGVAWWWFGHISEAQTDHTEQVTLEQAVEKLTLIHIRQATIAEAEAAQLARFCREGKLGPETCPSPISMPVPPVAAGAPSE
jgi:hypothetical protein